MGLAPKNNEDIRVKLLSSAKTLLKFDLNLIVLIKKLIYFESVMKILFNEDQINLIKAIGSREIDENLDAEEKLKELNKLTQRITDEKSIKDIKESFRRCSEATDEMTKKIIKLI